MTDHSRSRWGWFALRLVLAGLVGAHGDYRLITGGSVGFGEWLVSQHIPFGAAVAWAVTLTEVVGSVLLVIGRGVFVVGAGRNGAEYSVLLITALLCVGAQHLPLRRPAA